MSRLRPLRASFLALLATACSGTVDDAPAGARTVDSLGGTALTVDVAAWTVLPTVASVTRARRLGGGWALLDVTGRALHLLPDGADRARLLAAEGDGPGELRLPEALAVLDDTLWVVRSGADRMDAFAADGHFVRSVRLGASPCPGSLLHAATEWPPGVALAVQCMTRRTVRRFVGRADPATGAVAWTDFEPTGTGSVGEGVLSLDRMALARRDGALAVGLTGRPCLWVRPAPDGPPCAVGHDRTELAPAQRDTLRRDLAPRAGRVGLTLAVPTHDPFLWDVFDGPDGWWIARPDGSRLVLERFPGGDDPGRTLLPEGTRAFVDGGRMLLVRDVLGGAEVARLDAARLVR